MAMESISQIGDGMWLIEQPVLGESNVAFTNCYVLEDSGGDVHVIDPGWDTTPNWRRLSASLSSIGKSLARIAGIVVTHLHADHLGLARTVSRLTSAPLFLGRVEATSLNDLVPRRWAEPTLIDQLSRWGVPAKDRLFLVRTLAREHPPPFPAPDVLIDDDDWIPIPGRRIKAVLTPGHTPGHLCLLDEDNHILFTGDHVLPRINSGLGLAGEQSTSNPLVDYLHSLDRVESLSTVAFPGHHERIANLPARVREIRVHHLNRATEVSQLRRHDSTPWSIARQLRWRAGWDTMDAYHRHSAISQVSMHLNRLDSLASKELPN
jgi:glyoxylase-like metal-dependent hydrolase (beta-lactamase superfamily II)